MKSYSFLLPLNMLRKRVGLSQKQLAEYMGVSEDSIYNWESGRRQPRLSISQFKKLCEALQCQAGDLPDDLTTPR